MIYGPILPVDEDEMFSNSDRIVSSKAVMAEMEKIEGDRDLQNQLSWRGCLGSIEHNESDNRAKEFRRQCEHDCGRASSKRSESGHPSSIERQDQSDGKRNDTWGKGILLRD